MFAQYWASLMNPWPKLSSALATGTGGTWRVYSRSKCLAFAWRLLSVAITSIAYVGFISAWLSTLVVPNQEGSTDLRATLTRCALAALAIFVGVYVLRFLHESAHWFAYRIAGCVQPSIRWHKRPGVAWVSPVPASAVALSSLAVLMIPAALAGAIALLQQSADLRVYCGPLALVFLAALGGAAHDVFDLMYLGLWHREAELIDLGDPCQVESWIHEP